MGTLAQAYIQQSYTSTINGKVIENDAIRAFYNGKDINVDLYDNGQQYNAKLNKKDIKSILAKRAHPLSLEKRLINDFGMKSIKRKSIKRKSIKRKSIKRKSIKKNRI
jgi:hypothetical protein